MTYKEFLIKDMGREQFEKLPRRFRALVAKLDALPPLGKRGPARRRKRAAA